jgi:hypothetical protein
MSTSKRGTGVFVPDETEVWLEATIISVSPDGKLRVKTKHGDEREVDLNSQKLKDLGVDGIGSMPLTNSEAAESPGGVENMTQFEHLHEAAILHNVRRGDSLIAEPRANCGSNRKGHCLTDPCSTAPAPAPAPAPGARRCASASRPRARTPTPETS